MARRQRPARRARPAMRAGRYRAPSATQRPRQPDRVPRVAAKTFAQIPPVAVPRIAHGSTPREGRRRLYYPQLERVPPATVGLPVPRGSPGASSRGHDCAGSSVADELKEIQEASRSRRKTVADPNPLPLSLASWRSVLSQHPYLAKSSTSPYCASPSPVRDLRYLARTVTRLGRRHISPMAGRGRNYRSTQRW